MAKKKKASVGKSAAKTVRMIGQAIKRVEDPRLLKGIARYVDDMSMPGMLYMAVLRSPHANARIVRIDLEKARELEGVVGAFAGADINEHCGTIPCAGALPGMKMPRQTVLADGRAYYVGHGVAVVVAKDRYVARDALDLIEVDYDPLPAVVDPEKALEPGSPHAHPELGSNVSFTWSLANGNLEAAFKRADHVIKQRMVHQRLTPMAIEPRGCIAQFDRGAGTLTLWTGTQIPHLIRTLLPAMVGVPENKMRVVAPEVGGGFGSKLNIYAEEAICSHLAKRLGVPIKWIESRRENAMSTIHGRDQIGYYELAVKKDGTVLALKNRTIADIGSYAQLLTPVIPTLTGLMLAGCYKFQAVRMDVTGVFTNKMATDAYRGAGRPEATFLLERLMDLVAGELGLDPVEVRLKNFPRPKDFPFDTVTGLKYDSGNYQTALKKCQEIVDYPRLIQQRDRHRRAGRLFGVGVSTYVEICALGPSKAMPAGGWEWGCVRVEISGKVTVITGTTPHGQGQETSFAQIVSDRLGVPMGDIVVLRGDTNVAPYGRDTYGSRATVVGGTAIVMSCDKIIQKARILAAHLLNTKPKKCEFESGVFFVRGKRKQSVGWSQVAAEAYVAKNIPGDWEPGLEASSFYEPKNFTFPFGTHICAVEVDRDTGEIRIDKYAAVDDCGPQINPLLVRGQVQGGIAHSLGQAFFEQTVYDENGQLLTGEFMDYAMPRAKDIPEYLLGHTVTPSPTNPMGIKGVGEAGTIGSAPALVNAVMDALSPLGIKHLDMPLTPNRVWEAIRSASRERSSDRTESGSTRKRRVPVPA